MYARGPLDVRTGHAHTRLVQCMCMLKLGQAPHNCIVHFKSLYGVSNTCAAHMHACMPAQLADGVSAIKTTGETITANAKLTTDWQQKSSEDLGGLREKLDSEIKSVIGKHCPDILHHLHVARRHRLACLEHLHVARRHRLASLEHLHVARRHRLASLEHVTCSNARPSFRSRCNTQTQCGHCGGMSCKAMRVHAFPVVHCRAGKLAAGEKSGADNLQAALGPLNSWKGSVDTCNKLGRRPACLGAVQAACAGLGRSHAYVHAAECHKAGTGGASHRSACSCHQRPIACSSMTASYTRWCQLPECATSSYRPHLNALGTRVLSRLFACLPA